MCTDFSNMPKDWAVCFMHDCILKEQWDSRYLVGIGIYFGKPKKKETFIYNSS